MEQTVITPSHEALIQKVKGHVAYHGDDGLVFSSGCTSYNSSYRAL